MSALRELIAFFGVEVDDKKLDHAGEKMDGLAKLAEGAAATIGLAFGLHEIGEFVKGQIEAAGQLRHTSEALGIGVGDLQAFQYAAQGAGLGADEANTALRFLNKNLGQAALGNKEAAETFAKLGVKMKDADGHARPLQDVIGDVADGFVKLPDHAQKTARAMDIFGRAGARMIPILEKGSKGIQGLYDEFEELGGGMDEEFVENAKAASHEMHKVELVMKSVKSTIAAALLPYFTDLVAHMVDATNWFRELAKHSYIVQTALGTLAVIVGALALVWAALNFEVLLVVLAIALLVLIVDDVYTAFMGGKSVIGDFIDSLMGVGATAEIVAVVKVAARELWAELGYLYAAVKEVVSAFVNLETQGTSTTSGLATIKAGISGIGWVAKEATVFLLELASTLSKVINFYSDFKKDHPNIAKALESAGGNLNPVGGIIKDVRQVTGAAEELFGGDGPTHAPAGNDLPRAERGDVTQHNMIQIDVKGGPANADTGDAVAKGVKHGMAHTDMQSAYAAIPGNGGS